MKTVHEVSKLTGVSIRALQYYDSIGLLPASRYTQAGYRLYDSAALSRLSQLLLFRELGFPLKEIKAIMSDPGYDIAKAVDDQIALLQLQREHIDNLIIFARGIKTMGDGSMDFSAFDTKKTEKYKEEARARWGNTDAYREYESKSAGRSDEKENAMGAGLMLIFEEFGKLKDLSPAGPEAQALVRKLQSYITENFYKCTAPVLAGLGQMYCAGGEFTESIDAAGGAGTAQFASDAIAEYCK